MAHLQPQHNLAQPQCRLHQLGQKTSKTIRPQCLLRRGSRLAPPKFHVHFVMKFSLSFPTFRKNGLSSKSTRCCRWMTKRQRTVLRTHWVKAQLSTMLVSLRLFVDCTLFPPYCPRPSPQKKKRAGAAWWGGWGARWLCWLFVLSVSVVLRYIVSAQSGLPWRRCE